MWTIKFCLNKFIIILIITHVPNIAVFKSGIIHEISLYPLKNVKTTSKHFLQNEKSLKEEDWESAVSLSGTEKFQEYKKEMSPVARRIDRSIVNRKSLWSERFID